MRITCKRQGTDTVAAPETKGVNGFGYEGRKAPPKQQPLVGAVAERKALVAGHATLETIRLVEELLWSVQSSVGSRLHKSTFWG